MSKVNYYALYKDDELLTVGTYKELADYLNVSERTVKFYTTPTYKRRVDKSKYEVVKIEDEEDDILMDIDTKEIKKFIEKDNQKKWLDLFMILTEIDKIENIISFTYDKYYLTIKTGVNDYYRIHLTSKEVE